MNHALNISSPRCISAAPVGIPEDKAGIQINLNGAHRPQNFHRRSDVAVHYGAVLHGCRVRPDHPDEDHQRGIYIFEVKSDAVVSIRCRDTGSRRFPS